MVEMDVEVGRLEIGCMGASTPAMVYSTEVVREDMVEIVDWQVGNSIEANKTTEMVWTMKDEQANTKVEWMHSGWGCNMNKMPWCYGQGR